MAQPHEKPDKQQFRDEFAHLFEEPTLDGMLDLNPYDFEDFVGYVFERAGFIVEDTATQYGQGLDLKLFMGPTNARVAYAGVSVKQYRKSHLVDASEVRDLRGGLAGVRRGYLVTTSNFTDPALQVARQEKRVWPIDGEHLLRYITYARGSRPKASANSNGNASGSKNATPTGNLTSPPPAIAPDALFSADEITWRSTKQTKVLAVANHKGGVGKTTTALNLAFGLARKNKQVLLVDLDPQSNTTRAVPSPDASQAVPGHVGEYFAGRRDLASLVQRSHFDGVWLIPSDFDLRHEERGVAAGPEAELRLVRDIHNPALVPPTALSARPFDWIIFDTGPQMGFLTRSAIAASHYVVMVLEPGAFADMGLHLLLPTVTAMGALTGKPPTILGCVVTKWKENALNKGLLRSAVDELHNAQVDLIEPKIPDDPSHIERAHQETAKGKNRGLFNSVSPASTNYTAVIEEVLRRVH